MRKGAVLVCGLLLAGCGAPSNAVENEGGRDHPPDAAAPEEHAAPADSAERRNAASKSIAAPTYSGQLTQGGWIRGQLPSGATGASLGDQPLSIDDDRSFFAAFDRDAPGEIELNVSFGDRSHVERIAIAPREWNIEHVNVARRPGGPSASFMARRRPELAAIGAARDKDTGAEGWKQDFIWPVQGRISGRFGSQRLYRGEPGSYHSGMDITTGRSGTPFVAPADGVVVLAAEDFSLEGKLLIIDHGQGLNSAFLHASRLTVNEGDVVKQGQQIGNIGSSGRATGPHLHWGLKWHDARLDPLLFVGPMD